MPKIIVTDKLAEDGVRILEQAGFDVDRRNDLTPEGLKKIIGEYEGIVIRSQTKLTRDIIESAGRLRFIGRAGVGIDNVDLEAATKKGIIVMNAPGGNTVSTCELTFALMLALARKIPFAYNSLRSDKWERSLFKGEELYLKTLGIIGLGRIGKEIAKRAMAFGMEVTAYDPFLSTEAAESLGIRPVDLEELLKVSDFVTIHTPLNEETRNLISTKEISRMKPTAFLLNCARGGIVDEKALYKALTEEKIGGAALDVFGTEPPLGSDLLNLANNRIIVTPHLGATTKEAQVNVAVEIAHCFKDAFGGRAIRNAVNYIQLDAESYQILKPYMDLSELMGRFISQLLVGRPVQVSISYMGEIASYKVDPLGMSFMKGFLSPVSDEQVNLVNAMETASGRGIKVEQIKISQEEEYVNLIKIKIITDKGEKTLEGTLFSNKKPRLVRLDDINVEIIPSPYLIAASNWDKPGVVGEIGTILGKHGINIAGMSLGRHAPQGKTVTILNVDSFPAKEVLDELLANESIIMLKVIKL